MNASKAWSLISLHKLASSLHQPVKPRNLWRAQSDEPGHHCIHLGREDHLEGTARLQESFQSALPALSVFGVNYIGFVRA